MSETFAELLEESLNSSEMKPGAVIEAEVVDINGDYVIVNAGLKSESEIPVSQFRDSEGAVQVNIGDRVEVAIETVEDGYGNTRLSRERARRAKYGLYRRSKGILAWFTGGCQTSDRYLVPREQTT